MMAESLNGSNSENSPKTFSKIKTTNASIFLATNAGQNEILSQQKLNLEDLKKAMVNDGFSEFLLDRCRDIHVFYPPKTKAKFLAVLKAQLEFNVKYLEKQKNMKLSINNRESFLSDLANKYFNPKASFRSALSDIENAVATALAKQIISGNKSQCSLVLENNQSFEDIID